MINRGKRIPITYIKYLNSIEIIKNATRFNTKNWMMETEVLFCFIRFTSETIENIKTNIIIKNRYKDENPPTNGFNK